MKRKSLLFMLLFALLAPWAANAQQTLTVYEDGTATSSNVPVHGLWADAYLKCEFVVPADQLAEMTAGSISQMDFYLTSPAAEAWTGTFQVFLKEVENATIDAWSGTTDATIVYEGQLDGTASTMTVAFSQNYSYTGSNLLVGVYQIVKGNYKSATFAGATVTGASGQGYSSSSLDAISFSQKNFVPKTTFTYTAGATDCDMPTSIAARNVTADGATVTWEGDGDKWNLRYKASTDADFTIVENLTTASYTLSSLQGNTTYSVGVQTVCTGSTSFFKSTTFTTENPCAAPTNFVASNITASSATLSWTAGYQETAWTVKYKKSSESSWDNATTVSVSGTPTTSLTGLDGLTVYNVRVFNCTGENDPYLSGNFTTAASFPYSQDFTNSGIPAGWSQYTGLLADVMTGTALTSTSYGWNNGTGNGVLDGNHLYANIYSTGCKKWIVTPAIPVESGARLTFDVAYTAYSGTAADPQTTGTDDKFVVLISTDNMATWTILRQWDNAGSEYVLNDLTPATLHQVFDLADYAGQNTIVAFYAESTEDNTDNNIHVDNVVFELIPSCEKPTGLAVNYTGGLTAEVSWTSDASAWNLMVNGTQINNVTENPYTLTNLSLATTYNVAVQANCSGSTSEWTTPVSFTTDMCLPEDQCQLTFVLTDSYGDGWNGAYIDVVDVATGTSLAQMSNNNTAKASETETYTLGVCDGREIQFVWHSGSYDSECSFEIKDINGEVLANSISALPVNYTVDCTVATCFKPTNLAATNVLARSAELSWTENGDATEWVIDYNGTTITVNENPYVLEGLTPETAYTVKVKPVCEQEKWSDEITFTTTVACPAPTALTASNITPTGATISWQGTAESYNLRYGRPGTPDPTAPATIILTAGDVWQDGSGYQMLLDADATAYGTIIPETGGLTSSGDASAETYAEFEYKIPVNADGSLSTQNIVISNSISIQIPAGTYDWCITNPTPGDRMWIASSGGNVGGRADDYVFEAGMTYEFVVRLDDNEENDQTDVTIYSASDVVWTDMNNVTSPVTLEGLDSETLYLIEVQAVCGGEDGMSAWTSSSFPTLSACAVPSELNAEATADGATLNWTGYQESYNIQYRTAGFDGYYVNETWDGEIGDWTVYNFASGGGINTTAGVDGTACFVFHWTQNPPQYLFSPDLRAGVGGKTLTFSYKAYSANYAESFMVGFAIGEDITWEDEVTTETGDTDWHEYQVVVPEGTEYFIIECTSDDAYYLYIDNIVIYDETEIVEAGTWMTTTATGTTATLTGLESEKEYEWQVQGANCDGENNTEWSASDYFTTLTGNVTQETALTAGWNWFSTYIEVENPVAMLQALEASLGNNATQIKNSRINTEYDEEWGWFGDLDDEGMTNEEMYKIFVTTPCTVTLQGTPANTEEHSITINQGWNWIGFPSSVAISLENAFANFAAEGDKIKNRVAQIEYDPEWGWFGDFENLEPGQGYLYYSPSSTPRTLVYNTGAKTRANFGSFTKQPIKKVADINCKTKNGNQLKK